MGKEFYRYEDAVKYQRYLYGKGYHAIILEAYNWSEQRTIYSVVATEERSNK